MKLRFLSLFVSLTSLISINSAFAEETPASSSEARAPIIEEVIVTGSLLPRGDFVSKAPISTISSTQFEMSNSVNVESLINSMPQVVGGADRSSTFGQGIATANLRGLGENRTLVLINNRRFVPTFPDGGTVDLNFVPVGLIDRVEILTGGASAAYGSDALAGVINFILKEETDGWEFNGGGEITEKGDAEIYNFNFTNGGRFAGGKGSYLVHFDFLERKPVNFVEREISRVPLIDYEDENGEVFLGAAPNRFPATPTGGQFSIPEGSFLRFDDSGRNIARFTEIEIRGLGNFNLGFGLPDGTEEIGNINGFANLQLPQDRESFKGKISYEFDNSIEVYADLYYSKSEVPFNYGGPFNGFPNFLPFTATIEDNPFWSDDAKNSMALAYNFFNFINPNFFQVVDANNNGIPDTANLAFWSRSFTADVGPTETIRTFESLQLEIGIKGEINGNWGYEVFAQIGEVESLFNANPLLDPSRIQQGLLITADGNCIDPSNGCVALNVWGNDIGADGAAFITYSDDVGTSITENEQNVFMATISGNTSEWFTLPGDPGPIGIVLGAEYREINTLIDTSSVIEEQRFVGFAQAPYSLDNGIDDISFFGEALIPLVSGKTGIDFLELELGWRFSDHSQTGNDTTYKVALSYYPNPEWHVRGSYNRAMRAPAIKELFSFAQFVGGGFDPCTWDHNIAPFNFIQTPEGLKTIAPGPELDANCIAQGVPEENLYNPQIFGNQVPIVNQGGNADLLAEDGATYSIGVVWTPYIFDGLSVSVDYFDVEIENYIEVTPFTPPQLLRACYDVDFGRGGPGSAACNSYSRDPNGRLAETFLGYQNLGLHEVAGWDINIEYGLDFLSGYLDINYFATKINKRTIKDDSFGEVNFSCVGVFNGDCDNIIDYPVFDFKHRLTAAWSKNNLDLQLVWKYTSSLNDGNDFQDYFTEKLDDYSIVDLSGRYSIRENWMVTLGIKNLLDKKPERIGSNSWEFNAVNVFSISNTYTQYYDVFGRTMFLKASYAL